MTTWYQTAEYFKRVAVMADEVAKNSGIPMIVRRDAMAASTALQRLGIDIQAELHGRLDMPAAPALPAPVDNLPEPPANTFLPYRKT